jgi:5-dehydro-4-deoxyglucarate dehydratase
MDLKTIKSTLEDGLSILSDLQTLMRKENMILTRLYHNVLNWFVGHKVSSVFVAGGTGEFFSLSANAYQQIITHCAKNSCPGASTSYIRAWEEKL